MPSRDVDIINRLGLHARAAAKFVNAAGEYTADLEVERDGQRVNGKSIMGVMMLAAGQGSTLTLHAEGEDADALLDGLEALLADRFGEDE